MERSTGPGLWILGCFLFYTIVLSLFFNLPERAIIPTTKLFTVAHDATWAPFSFAGKESQLTAFTDELLSTIAEDQQFIIHVRPASPNNLFSGLNNGDYEGVLSARTMDGVVLKKYYTSPIFYAFGPVIIAKIPSNIRTAEDLRGRTVGITSTVEFLMQYPTDPDTTYISYPHISDALAALANGSVQAVIGSKVLAEIYVSSLYRDKLSIVSVPLSDSGLRLFTLRNEEGLSLIKLFSDGLENLKKNGVYAKLLQKWKLMGSDQNIMLYSPPEDPAQDDMKSPVE